MPHLKKVRSESPTPKITPMKEGKRRGRKESERLERLGLWSLEERRNIADIIEVFKMAKGWSAIPLQSMFELSTTKHLRGHNLKLVKHRSNLELRRNFSPKGLSIDGTAWINSHWMWTRLIVSRIIHND